jgi:prepilin-type N-terminal cleavage/methylation domain-containing protein
MKTPRLFSSRAFTLLEVLIALTISGFALAGIMTLYYYVLQNDYVAEQRLGANDDVRYFTGQMIADARASNIVRLYKSFYPYTTVQNYYPFTGTGGTNSTAVTPYTPDNPLDSSDQVPLGGAGDYIVFISYSDPFQSYPTTTIQPMYINRLILYWIAPNVNFSGETAMYRFDSKNLAAGAALPWTGGVILGSSTSVPSSTVSLESLLPANTLANAQASWAQIVINDVRGQATDSIQGNIGLNFINWPSTNKSNASVLMHSLILHGNASKRLTDTYNFTITPGG